MTPNSLHPIVHGQTTSSFHRPLGRPASDLSMYYDKNSSFPPASPSRVRKSGNQGQRGRGQQEQLHRRPATTIPCITGENNLGSCVSMNRRSWPLIEGRSSKNSRHLDASETNPTDYRQLISSQLSSHTIGDQRRKVGIRNHGNGRPHTHDIAKLPSFKTQQKTCQPSGKQVPSRPHSEQTMYKLPKVSKVTNSTHLHQPVAAALQLASNGLSVRHSSYRSLANNPNLKVVAKQGRVKISRRRPKSLPSKLQEGHQLESPRDKVTLSGWQSRNRSPTFTTLAQTKEHLDAALSRKLWAIRRHVDGQRARNNSAAFSSSSLPDSANPEEWYERMLRDHSDEDLAAIETLCIANHDDNEQVDSVESISLEATKPSVDIKFDKNYLKAHINDWNILALMQEEERNRAEKEYRKSKKSKTTKSKRVPKTLEVPKIFEQTHTAMPPIPEPETIKEEKRVRVVPKPEPLEQDLPKSEHAVNTNSQLNTNSNVETHVAEQTEELQCESKDNEEQSETVDTGHLVAKYLAFRDPPIIEEELKEDEHHNCDDKVTEDPKGDEDAKDTPVEEKKLTEKEKFLLMRQRMEDRKAEKQKIKMKATAGFGDYVRLGMNVKKGAKNFLGSLMSSRLEKMTTFKSGDADDDSDDSSDDEEEEDEGGGEV